MSPPLTKNARENYVVSVSLIVLTSISVLMRLSLKLYRRQVPQGPDWMCFIATGIFIAYASLIINCKPILFHSILRSRLEDHFRPELSKLTDTPLFCSKHASSQVEDISFSSSQDQNAY